MEAGSSEEEENSSEEEDEDMPPPGLKQIIRFSSYFKQKIMLNQKFSKPVQSKLSNKLNKLATCFRANAILFLCSPALSY
jgi:hypothetical protein